MDPSAEETEGQPITTEETKNEEVSTGISEGNVEDETGVQSGEEQKADHEQHEHVNVSMEEDSVSKDIKKSKEMVDNGSNVVQEDERVAVGETDEVIEDYKSEEIKTTSESSNDVENVETGEPTGERLNEGQVSTTSEEGVGESVEVPDENTVSEEEKEVVEATEGTAEDESGVQETESDRKEVEKREVQDEDLKEQQEEEIKEKVQDDHATEGIAEDKSETKGSGSDRKEEEKKEIQDEKIKEIQDEDIKEKQEEEIKEKVENDWLDILGNGQLRKKVIKGGKEGNLHPVAGQEVCIKTEGTLENGNKVDVFEEKTFVLGDGDVITAWDLCVSTMTEGEICQLISAPRFAYGSIGREDEFSNIPGDSEITYTLELINMKPGPDIGNLTDEERLEIGDAKRERGNELFRREDYSEAVYSYSRALKYLEPSTSQEVVNLQVKCWNNIAASHLKVQEYIAAKTACDSVLKVDPSNVKALFRKGKVLLVTAENYRHDTVLNTQGEYEEALELLRKANSLEPDNRLIRREFMVAKEKFDEERKKQRSMYQRMVNGLGDKSKTTENESFFTWPVILGITGVALGGIIAAVFFVKHQV